MKHLFIILLLISNKVFSQKIYVDCSDSKPKGSIEKKITELNYVVVQDSLKADIKAKFAYEKAKSAMSFKVKPNIYAKIIFYSANDELLSTTEEVGGLTAAWSGYNPRVDAAWKILSRDFEQTLKDAISKLYSNTNEKAKTITEEKSSSTTKKENSGSLADELAKLKKLYDDGAITEDEYKAAKQKLLEK